MVTLVRRGLHTFYYGEYKELKPLHQALTQFVEGAIFSERYKRGFWDGTVKFYDKRGAWFWFGLIEHVLDALSKARIDFKLEGYDDEDTDWIQFSPEFLADDRDFQREAITDFIERTYGTIMIPTRGGKTFVASEIIRLLRGRNHADFTSLFLVDNVDLFNQAINDISNVARVPLELMGRIRESTFEPRLVNVATIQTVQSALKGQVSSRKKVVTRADQIHARERKWRMEKLLRKVDLLIIDEVQEYGISQPRLGALRKAINARYILSLSATPYKHSNKLHQFNVESFSGGIVYEIEERELVEKKVLADSRALMLLMDHKDAKPWMAALEYRELFDKLIIRSDRRNGIALAILTVCDSLGLKTLAIFNSVEHGRLIQSMSGYQFLSGEDNEEKRAETKRNFLSKKGGVLLVSDIWKKGITLPSVEILLNMDGGKESSLVIQRRGRVLGVTETKKKALTIDFIDDYQKYFNEHSLERIKAYEEKLGKEAIDVMDPSQPDFIRDLEEYLINWFELNIQ